MPTLGTYSYSLLQRILNTKIHGKRANLTSGESGDTNVERDLINSGVRVALSDIDFRGNIIVSSLTPGLMENQYDYALPADFKGDRFIDLSPQNTDCRDEFESYDLVSQSEFDKRKNIEKGIATIINDQLTRCLRVSADIDDDEIQVSTMEDTDWRTFDSVSVNDSDVKVDNDDFIEGNGSIRFKTDCSDTSDSVVGIQNTNLSDFDISNYLARGSVFVDAKLTVADTGIHQISLRIGSDSDNYYQISDSTQNDCSIFVAGWNKIRFDMQNKSQVGTPADSAITYAALFWSRDTTTSALLHLNDTDWGFDNLLLKRGKYYNLSYYSRYVWQDTAYSLAENSSHDSYTLLIQNDELEVIMAKIAELASGYLRDYEDVKYYNQEYQRLKQEYLSRNPSQASVLTTSRYNFESTEDEVSDDDNET
jgi:hypothetical protein